MSFLSLCAALCFSVFVAFASGKTKCERLNSKIAAAWYTGWHSDNQAVPDFPLSDIPWGKYTHLTWAFAETSPNVDALDTDSSNVDLLPQFVSEAHKHGVKALISVGGWSGSRFFSSAVATPENRTAFIQTLSNFTQYYSLDGIDFDWEYPGTQGLGCNTISPHDTTNFLSFLQEFRATTLGSKIIISAATAINPFPDANGNPSDVSGFAKVLDWLAIMNYDLSGPWNVPSIVAANAPLYDSCQPAAYQWGSAMTGIERWSAAGFPVEKLVLGVPAYGHSFKVYKENAFVPGTSNLQLYPSFDSSQHPAGDAWDDEPGVNACGDTENQGGVITFWGLIENGFLDGTGHPSPHPDISYVYDSCTQTPFVYNATSEVMVSFDNQQSSLAKGKFIQQHNLAGFATWEAGGDYKHKLLDSLRMGAGFHQNA